MANRKELRKRVAELEARLEKLKKLRTRRKSKERSTQLLSSHP